MRWRRLMAASACCLCGFPIALRSQFTDPRQYDNSPVGVNEFELAYAHARSNATVDQSQQVVGAKLQLNLGTVTYTRYVGLLGRMAWVQASLPIAALSGEVNGTTIHGSVAGTGDSEYQAAVLLKGGPALSVAEFAKFNPTSTVGVSLTIAAPTGSYDANRVLNLGADRWSFKPEFAYSLPFGTGQRWELNAYANVYFYTDNTSYKGVEVLSQRGLGGLEGHISYSFNDNIWLALDTRYSFRGETVVDGVNQNDSQQNFILGTQLNINLNARNSVTVGVAGVLVHVNGPSETGVTVRYDYSWGGGLK